MKNGSCSVTTVNGSAALPFVISTGAQRSGEICGVSGPFLGNVSTEVMEKRVLFSSYRCWKRRPPLCHLDRSAAQWRDLRFNGPFLEMFFDRGVMGQGTHPRVMKNRFCSATTLNGSAALPFVIS